MKEESVGEETNLLEVEDAMINTEKESLLRYEESSEVSLVTPLLVLSVFSAVIGSALPMGYNNGVSNAPAVR